jgi:glycosyltransferase involved in cell wall biosynthesis
MKIVQLIYSLSSGGAERFVVDLSNELARRGHEVHLVIFRNGDGSEFYRPLVDGSVHFHNLRMREGFGPIKLFKLIKFLASLRPDVIHAHLNVIPYIFPLAVFTKKIKFVHTLHSVAAYASGVRLQKWINRFFYQKYLIQPIAISQACGDSYEEFYGLARPEVVNNGRSELTPTSDFPMVEAEVAGYLNREKKPVFIHVGRFASEKNQDLLVSAFNKIEAEGVGFLLLVIGRGFDQPGGAEELRERACSSIKFLGKRSNVEDYLFLSDAFCLSSRYEGLPISLLEALAAGCVPICTAVGGIPDVVSEGVTGYLSHGDGVESYCDAIRRYIRNPDYIRREDLQKYYTEHYSIETCAAAYESIYGT